MGFLKDIGRKTVASTGQKLLRLADRADERGGEIRDELKEKLKSSRRVQMLREGVKGLTQKPVETYAAPQPTRSAQSPGAPPEEELKFSYGDERKAVQVFGGRGCPWTGRALSLLESAGVEVAHVDLDHPASGPMREELSVETGQRTVPYVFLRGDFIGGYNALDEIHRLGKLEYFTIAKNERAHHPDHGTFEIAAREATERH